MDSDHGMDRALTGAEASQQCGARGLAAIGGKIEGTPGNLTTCFNDNLSGGDGLPVERDEGDWQNSSSRWLRSGKVKLRWGVSAVRHGEGLGAFYRASEGAERAEGRTIGGFGGIQWRNRFGFDSAPMGGEMKGRDRERKWRRHGR
jgi:hypothetical protein